MSTRIGGMNPGLPKLAKQYAELLASKKDLTAALVNQRETLSDVESQIDKLAIEINTLAGKSYGGPNIIETSPGQALLIEYGCKIKQVNFSRDDT